MNFDDYFDDEWVENHKPEEYPFFSNLKKYISKIIYDEKTLGRIIRNKRSDMKKDRKAMEFLLRERLWIIIKNIVHLPTNITVKEWFLRRIEYPYAKRLSKRQLVNKRILEFIANKGKLISVEDYKKCYLDQYWGYMNHENGCDDFLGENNYRRYELERDHKKIHKKYKKWGWV
jgi:hypothetical protein